MHGEHSVAKPGAQQTGGAVIVGARQLRGLVEKVLPAHAPPLRLCLRGGVFTLRADAAVVLVRLLQTPLEHRAVLGDGEAGVSSVARERDVHERLPVSRQRRRRVSLQVVGAVHARGEILRADDDPAAVRAPPDARRVVVHAPVLAQKPEWRELLEHRGRRPDLQRLARAHRERAAARRKLARRDFRFEVHVVQHDAFPARCRVRRYGGYWGATTQNTTRVLARDVYGHSRGSSHVSADVSWWVTRRETFVREKPRKEKETRAGLDAPAPRRRVLRTDYGSLRDSVLNNEYGTHVWYRLRRATRRDPDPGPSRRGRFIQRRVAPFAAPFASSSSSEPGERKASNASRAFLARRTSS